jgi:hypothetical protein
MYESVITNVMPLGVLEAKVVVLPSTLLTSAVKMD